MSLVSEVIVLVMIALLALTVRRRPSPSEDR